MAAHNAATFLREAIQSILDQSFQDFEFVIINDGSTDGTEAVLNSFLELDARIRIFNQPHAGLTRSLNRGLKLCSCGLVARMDADDISHPDRLAKQFAFMEAHPEVSVLGCRYRTVANDGSILGCSPKALARPQEAMWRLPFGSTLPHPGVIFRKDAVVSAGAYDEDRQHAQDYDLWCRLVRMGHGIANLPDLLLDYRAHPKQVSSVHGHAQRDAAQTIAQQFFSWALGENAPALAVSDIRKLCSGDLTRAWIGADRLDNVADLSNRYIVAVGERFSRRARNRARRYLARKLLRASLEAASRLDTCAIHYLKASTHLRIH